ncbi:hypothetical protein TRFO_33111 [Tritrichomonas foetus]|uniref:Uncharacterized protein n=1 Tax=Tritrichomonas foetus TaxID=1144522 RepID=A0A1J4JMB4_9EUKA|nr:hypothetical protein TRFO_33111 [Tritrichomonas foetus]|eukprot:OHT00239.1 hypothetical protein TRFO_33111 [Tritrichomonas foetus]
MKELKILRYLYPAYVKIRFVFPFPVYFKWILAFVKYFNFLFLVTYSCLPSTFFDTLSHNGIHYIMSILYFLPWIFGTDDMLYDAFFWSLFNIIFIIVIVYTIYGIYNNKYIPYFFKISTRLISQFLIPLMSFPLFFRIALIIEYVITDLKLENFLTLFIYFVNFLVFILHQYISSIFFVQFSFIQSSSFDVYDGKSHVKLYLVEFIFALSLQLLPIWNKNQLYGLLAILYLSIVVYICYYRLITVIHVSKFVQYMELSPLFAIPFMFLYHLYGTERLLHHFFFLLLLHLVFIIIINLIHIYNKKTALQVFSVYLSNDDSASVNLPSLVIINLTSILRILAFHDGNPEVLSRFLDIQKKEKRLKTSVFIEIARFISIFPERRHAIVKEIRHISSHSNHNIFTLYLFKKTLKSYSSTRNDHHYEALNELYLSYSVHFFLYWNARIHQKPFKAFYEAFSCIYFFIEEMMEIESLIKQYPSNSYLHKLYGELMLNLGGDYFEYKKQIKIAKSIENSDFVLDPLLHSMRNINPRVLQFQNKGSLLSSSSSSFTSNINLLKIDSNNSFHTKTKKSGKNSKRSVASKIQKSNKKVPYMIHFCTILPSVIILFFVSFALYIEFSTTEKENLIFEHANLMITTFYKAISSIFVPYALITGLDEYNLSNCNCQEAFNNLPNIILSFFSDSSLLNDLDALMLALTFQHINDMIRRTDDVCVVLEELPNYMTSLALVHLKDMENTKDSFYDQIKSIYTHISQNYRYIDFIWLSLIILFVFLIIYFIFNCYFVNNTMKHNKEVIEFLASEERLLSIIQGFEVRENIWEQLKDYASISLNTSESSFNLSQLQMESESDLTDSRQSPITTINDSIDLSESENPYSSKKRINLNSSLSTPSFSGSFSTTYKKKSIPNTVITDSIIIDHSSETDQSSQILPNDSNIVEIVMKKEKEDKYAFWQMVISLLSPWLFLFVFIVLMIYPLISRRNNEQNKIISTYTTFEDMKNALKLFTISFYQYNNGSRFINLYNEVIDHYSLLGSSIAELFFEELCVNLSSKVILLSHNQQHVAQQPKIKQSVIKNDSSENLTLKCTSIYSIVKDLISDNESNNTLLMTYYLPNIALFSQEAIVNVFYTNITNIHPIKHSCGPCFLISVILIIILINIFRFRGTLMVRRGMNSLFHFPDIFGKKSDQFEKNDQNINDLEKTSNLNQQFNQNHKKRKKQQNTSNLNRNEKTNKIINFPTNIILVTSITESDEIYSVSENSSQIINKSPSDLICRKCLKTFPIIEVKDEFQIRENSGKTFLTISEVIGRLTKSILIETTKIETKHKNFNSIQKLTNFIPVYFAKKYSEDLIKSFHFKECIIIFIRINPKAGQLEKFFTCVDMQIQMYFCIELIRTNGSIISCLCRNQSNLFEVYLFLRDIIRESEISSKGQVQNFALHSIFFTSIGEINFDVTEGTEPYISTDDLEYIQKEMLIYEIDQNFIGFGDFHRTLNNIDKITSFSTPKILKDGSKINVCPFSEYTKSFITTL